MWNYINSSSSIQISVLWRLKPEQKLSITIALTIVLLPHCSSRSNTSTKRGIRWNWVFRGQRKENLLNRIQFQIPQRLIPSASPRSHVTFALLARIEGVALLSHHGRARNLRRNQLPWFTFLTGKWNTNGATWSVKKH